jgi:hypothetical protein
MLRKHLDNWASYSTKAREHFTLIVIDDASPEPASDVIRDSDGVQLYRIAVDRPWGRNLARNLSAHVCETPWLIQCDLDHVLPPSSADTLLETEVSTKFWYRFHRWRVGKADETRRKDTIPESCEWGPVKPHIDSYLITRELFVRAPYDGRYVGFLGGGSSFLKRMESIAPVKLLPESVCLHVHTRHSVPDASITTLSRDTTQYAKVKKEIERTGNTAPKLDLDFAWSRVF